ncbi:MAG: 4Fe-4S binding protein [Cardiobacteriaceae bacterium]|nr:4Fe-4S binding protein [Cardiobacteriaceae bacterium]
MWLLMTFTVVRADADMASQTAYISTRETLEEFLEVVPASDFFPQATGYGAVQHHPHLAPIVQGDTRLGYAFLNTDYVNAGGYSGKPVKLLIGVDNDYNIRAVKLVRHSEPIVLIGIPEAKINAFLETYRERNFVINREIPTPDVISGATVTIMVINETIARAAQSLARQLGSGGQIAENAPAQPEFLFALNEAAEAAPDWQTMLEKGEVAHLHLSVGDVNQAFDRAGKAQAAALAESENPEDAYIDLYVADVTHPALGKALLGNALYTQASSRLKEGEALVLVAGNGLYSFKGSGYVRGGIFDRVKLEQDGAGFHFRDRNHRRLADVMAKGAPKFPEVALFTVEAEHGFDGFKPWAMVLLSHRATGATAKEFIEFRLPYRLPEHLLLKTPNPDYVPPAPPVPAEEAQAAEDISIQAKIARDAWSRKAVHIGVLALALVILIAVFMFQDWFAQRPEMYKKFRIGYLCFTLFWIGGYLGAQLSVVNVLTFTNALIHGFDWSYFLMDPMIFMLWCATAFGALLWNRGSFCGWLCPFGALQELTNTIAKTLGVKQIKFPFKIHERMTALKYIIFLLLFGFSLYDLGLAEHLAEVEPFKTSIILKFQRAWPYVAFALAMVAIGLFIERFYCRYLCPLGAALAIPAKLRLFNWLKRYRECGNPCQKCAQDCPVEAIFPEGNINENECIQCLNCQVLYHDQKRCMHLLQEIAKAQKAAARKKRVEDIKSGDIVLEPHN